MKVRQAFGYSPLAFSLQVVNWLEGPGSEQLRAQWGIGDSIRASQALQQKHEEIESQHSVRSFPQPRLHSELGGTESCAALCCAARGCFQGWCRAQSAYVECLEV